MSNYLTDAQVKVLLAPIREGRVGKDGKGFRHVEAYEIRAHLTRIFGFGRWSADVVAMELVFEDSAELEKKKDGKGTGVFYLAWTVCYRAAVRLSVSAPDGTVLATYTEWATGEATNQPSKGDGHDLALKTAESQALKRCAVNLGDSFGLSLYRKGSLNPIVQRLVENDPNNGEKPAPTEIDAHVIETPPESEQPDPAPDVHEQSAPPVQVDDVDAKTLRVQDLTAQLLAANTRAGVAGITGQILKEKLGAALTYDADSNALSLGALADSALKRVTRRGAA